ncbi:hypothetical protein DACRYDRAFT_18041 [Dacryopinax primogenitus]|uniref:Uncharacterized protein n=1 Tax=Dacryopinax primogenitus (strain DJM 731) TaxID=1858805 RepID=M5FSW4_DACPD|nr:uncharacterized protein DACRYDRAFT_18041 [Dacryopinax primogenitus]EJT98394.1 hypothetical protein DACRYDRAFT_18041 [Dacryopinax primogenitus]
MKADYLYKHGSGNQFSQLSSEALVPQSSDASAQNPFINRNARRPQFNTNLQVHAPHREELNLNRVHTCPVPGVFSCTPEAQSTTSCCVQKPGGVLLHVQLWDVGIGLPNSWGIHGLWPDLCNGGYDESHDGDGRAYTPEQISDVLAASGPDGQSLVDFMNQVWLSNDDSPSEFWAHEASDAHFPGRRTVCGCRRSNQAASMTTRDFVCKGRKLSQVEYYLRAQGPVQDGNFVQSHPTRNSNCPDEGIEYPMKYRDGEPMNDRAGRSSGREGGNESRRAEQGEQEHGREHERGHESESRRRHEEERHHEERHHHYDDF